MTNQVAKKALMDKILLKLLASYFRSSVALSKLGQTPLSFPFSSDFSSGD